MGSIDETLQKACDLCTDSSLHKRYSQGMTLFHTLIVPTTLDTKQRLKALLRLIKISPEEANDKIVCVRDSLNFLKDQDFDRQVDLLREIVLYPQINSHERLSCAVCVYNHNVIERCYEMFLHLASDPSVLVDYRVEAIKYLRYSEVEDYMDITKTHLMTFISTKEYPSEYRYSIIASFNSKTGIFTFLNYQKLNIDYDENLLADLQKQFFFERSNGLRERILSGQHLLSMESVTIEIKKDIVNVLFDIAKNYRGEDAFDIRADAADVVLRLGIDDEQKQEARNIISQLGLETQQQNTLHSQTIYNDKQNVHDSSINASIIDYIDSTFSNGYDSSNKSYQNVHSQVTELIYKTRLSSSDRIKALNRISIDTATFGKKCISMPDIFVHVWECICKMENSAIETVQRRLLEELVEMSNTCSSGHASRLINVLSGYGFDMKISWKDQILSNFTGRFQRELKSLPEEDKQNAYLGMMQDADEKDRKEYIQIALRIIPSIVKELEDEFVTEGFISKANFDNWIKEATNSVI